MTANEVTVVLEVLVALWTTAPEPLVPVVSTPLNSKICHWQPFWVRPAKSMVTAPALGLATMPRNIVQRRLEVPAIRLAICTQVIPLPLRVGVSGVEDFELPMHAITSLLPVGVIDAVVYDVASVSLKAPVRGFCATAILVNSPYFMSIVFEHFFLHLIKAVLNDG